MDMKSIKEKLTAALPAYLRNDDESPEAAQQQDVAAATTAHG